MDYDIYIDETTTSAADSTGVYSVNKDLTLARRLVDNTSSNLFLTGKAGTGKTTFLRRLRSSSPKRMVVLAPTGVAAINAGGQTIHSFFQLSFCPFIPGQGFVKKEKSFKFSKTKIQLIRSLDLLVIDEISMVRPDILDAVDDVLRRIRMDQRPFGGVQLLLIGDLRQLSPVRKESEWCLLREHYDSEYFFESHALRRAGFLTIELTEIFRQSDPEFIRILNAVREGQGTREILDKLNARYRPAFNPPDSEKYIRLTSHNRLANEINLSRLRAIDQPEFTFKANVKGTFPDSSYPAEPELRLKKGSQVMFIKNDPEMKFYNGMIGTVTDISENSVTVHPADGSQEITTGYVSWDNTTVVMDEKTGELKEQVVGCFEQVPLRPAWAITIHKSQGLTFERAIIDAAMAFAPGQTYVALSRCKSLEGLVLDSKLPFSAIIVDPTVNEFMARQSHNRPDGNSIRLMMRSYFGDMVCELFSFDLLNRLFGDFLRLETEYVANTAPQRHIEFTAASESIRNEIYPVGQRFATLYHDAFKAEDSDDKSEEANKALMEKIKRGCSYFSEKLSPIVRLCTESSFELDNKVYQKRMDNTFGALREEIMLKARLLETFMHKDFVPAEYLTEKSISRIQIEKEISQKIKKQAPLTTVETSAPALYAALSQWRRETAQKTGKPAFTVMHNKGLQTICEFLPTSVKELAILPGIGQNRAKQYGDSIVELVREYMSQYQD